MDMRTGIKLLFTGYSKYIDDKLYLRWIHDYGNDMSFDDYKKSLTPYRASTESEKDYILKKYGGG